MDVVIIGTEKSNDVEYLSVKVKITTSVAEYEYILYGKCYC